MMRVGVGMLIAALFYFTVAAATTFDPTLVPFCTDISGRFTQAAVNCEDTAGASFCGAFNPIHFYSPNSQFVPARLGGDAKYRLVECYSGDNFPFVTAQPDPSYVYAAVASCAKTCGFCCMTPQFSCRNPANSQMNCETVTQNMCRDPKWRELIAANCPNKCGFCLEGKCVDAAVDCDSDPNICFTLVDFAKANCKRTCGFCDGLASASCGDALTNCFDLVSKGFCGSIDYTQDEKKKLCGKSCRLC